MQIGIPKEVKVGERRVALTPNDCRKLISKGHSICLQEGAGDEAGYIDQDYLTEGVELVPDAKTLYGRSELIVKVKEPQKSEYELLRADHTLFCYLHLAASSELTETLKKIGLTAIAFETIEENNQTPLLAPMSMIAGRLAVQIGTHYLHASNGGRGVLLGGFGNDCEGNVTVIGAGTAGSESIALAYNMGAYVTVFDINESRLEQVEEEFPGVRTLKSSRKEIINYLKTTDLLIGAVYLRGRKAPILVDREMVQSMPERSVIVDIAIDQGGCVETIVPCTHEHPTYTVHGVIHSGITNLPAAVPMTASKALSSAIMPYVQQIAAGVWTEPIRKGVNVQNHEVKILF